MHFYDNMPPFSDSCYPPPVYDGYEPPKGKSDFAPDAADLTITRPLLEEARAAKAALAGLTTEEKKAVLRTMADCLLADTQAILAANDSRPDDPAMFVRGAYLDPNIPELKASAPDKILNVQWIVGIIMACDNLAALILLPLFGSLSDRTKTPIGKRMPYILVGTFVSAVAFPFIPLFFHRNNIAGMVAMMAVVLMFMGAVAEPLLYCLIGPQWHEASTYLPFICIYMSFYPLNAINLNMLQVQGRSDIFLRLEIIKKIMGVAPICMGIFINIYWMLIGSIITGFISIFLNTYYTGKTLGYTTWKQLRDIAPSYALGLLMGVSVYFIKNLDMNYWTILAIQCAVGAAIFFGVCELTKMQDYTVVKGIVMQYISKLRNR